MSRLFWLIIAAIAILALILISNDQSGTTLGIANDAFASAAYLGIWGVVLAAGLLGTGIPLSHMARNIAIWLIIILALVAGYQYRFDLENVASRITAGLIPGNAISHYNSDGSQAVTISQSANGHFQVNALVNDRPLRFLVDTGASSIVLSHQDALKIGITDDSLNYSVPIVTANGTALAAPIRLQEIKIGPITRNNIKALVTQSGQMQGSLLGMSFLNSLRSYTVQRDQLILTD